MITELRPSDSELNKIKITHTSTRRARRKQNQMKRELARIRWAAATVNGNKLCDVRSNKFTLDSIITTIRILPAKTTSEITGESAT